VRYDAVALEKFLLRNLACLKARATMEENVSLFNEEHMALRVSLEWQTLPWELQDFPQTEAKKVEALVLARLLEGGRAPGCRRVPTLATSRTAFSNGWSRCRRTVRLNRQPAGITVAGNS